jgi:alkyl hydroperoxide reductase subunit AhpF
MAEPLLNEDIRQQVLGIFQQLKDPIQVMFFGAEVGCDYCSDTLQLIQEVADLSEKITLRVHDLDQDVELAKQYQIDKVPMLVIAGKNDSQIVDYGVRFAGIPAGHEFSSLIHVMVMVSGRDSSLQDITRQFLKKLKEPVRLQVFVTPT